MITRHVVLTLSHVYRDGTEHWTLWLSYVRGIGEIIATGIDHQNASWHWTSEPLQVAA